MDYAQGDRLYGTPDWLRDSEPSSDCTDDYWGTKSFSVVDSNDIIKRYDKIREIPNDVAVTAVAFVCYESETLNNLKFLKRFPNLKELVLNFCTNLKSLKGIEVLENLTKLELKPSWGKNLTELKALPKFQHIRIKTDVPTI